MTDGPGDLLPRLVDPVPAGSFGAGLPAGTLGYCTGLALAVGALAGRPVSGVGVAVQLRLPEVMAAAYGSSFDMRPAAPLAVAGGGWLHADLGAPGDRDSFHTLLSTLPPGAPAADVARTAQEWRLPVCDYRPLRADPVRPPWSFGPGPVTVPSPDRPLQVLDLTSMWAGPLATWLLQDLGAKVIKVEPAFRPDGFRALDGRGIHPDGRVCDPGRDSAMWNTLNSGKQIIDLDLRKPADRAHFVRLASASDVVIDSFSPRVMPNFAMSLPDGPLYVSMPAFPPGPQRSWVAYGNGIHAVSGLGDDGRGGFWSPAVSYPDPVSGFSAALGVLAAVAGRRRGVPIGRVECPLASAVQPMAARLARPGPPGPGQAGTGATLWELGTSCGLFEPRAVCGRPLPHPRTIFPGKQNVF